MLREPAEVRLACLEQLTLGIRGNACLMQPVIRVDPNLDDHRVMRSVLHGHPPCSNDPCVPGQLRLTGANLVGDVEQVEGDRDVGPVRIHVVKRSILHGEPVVLYGVRVEPRDGGGVGLPDRCESRPLDRRSLTPGDCGHCRRVLCWERLHVYGTTTELRAHVYDERGATPHS